MYLSEQELVDGYLPGDVESRSTPLMRELWIGNASALADGYLRTAGYDLPLATWGEDLKAAVGAIAAFRLASKLGLVPQPAHQSDLYLNQKAAMTWLEQVAEGRTKLDLVDSTPDVEIATGPLVESDPRRGW